MRTFLFASFMMVFGSFLAAQNTPIEDGMEQTFAQSVTLFNQGLYASARSGFDELLASELPAQSFLMEESSYYRALCALYLMNANSEYYFEQFAQTYPLSPRWMEAHMTAANYHFNNRRYKNAIPFLEGLDPRDVRPSHRSDYYFKLAYSYLQTRETEKARAMFSQGLQVEGEYQPHHIYYYGHIAYEAEQYTTAKEQFIKLISDEKFGGVVPYYLCQIYYKTGDLDELLRTGAELLDKAVPSRAAEVAKLIGEGYYERKDWKNASLYLEKHRELGGSLTVEDHYKLGFVLYKTGRFEEAVTAFNKIHDRGDNLGQSAYYHLADCYMKLDKKEEAQSAFFKASESGKDAILREDAFFNYAKLSYESSTPFEQPLQVFQEFLNKYPNSKHRGEANEYLANLYLNSKDYGKALKAISAAGLDQPTMQAAYQKVAYFRGVQFFNAIQYPSAKELFEESLKYPFNKTFTALSHYWLSEIAYREKKYDEALIQLGKFERVPGSITMSEYVRSLYSKAYIHFSMEQYEQAAVQFRLFLTKQKAGSKLANDATLRLADSYFMTAQYNNAVNFYGKYLNEKVPDPDYAMFQRALCYGLLDEDEKKSAQLQTLVNEQPQSVYATDAYFELGETFMKLGQTAEAEDAFTQFLNKYPKSRFVKNAKIALGLIYRSQSKGELALDKFKDVVEEYPGTSESREALSLAKMQYSENGNLSGYVDWIQTLTGTDVGRSQLDSTLFNDAYDKYSFDNCAGAISGMQQYLEKFPDGIFRVSAHYYMAECAFTLERDDLALESYEFVAASGDLSFRKRTVERLATLYYARQNHEKAYYYFEQVLGLVGNADEGRRARLGLMRCALSLNNTSSVLQYAESLLQDEGLPEDWRTEALVNAARSAMTTKDSAASKMYYAQIMDEVSGEAQVEAAYYLAYFDHLTGKYQKSIDAIFWMTKNLPTYTKWRWMSLYLLAQNYAGIQDDFQANYTLDYIIENCDFEDYAQQAAQFKSDLALRREREAEQSLSRDTLELNTDTNIEDDDEEGDEGESFKF